MTQESIGHRLLVTLSLSILMALMACAPAAAPQAPAAQPAKPASPGAVPAAPQTAAPAPAAAAQPAAAAKKQIAPGFEVDAALFEAAKKEGQVVFWGSMREQEVKQLVDKFQEITGIKVESTRLSAGPMFTRLTKEREAKLYTVDVIQHGDLGLWQIHMEKKNIVPYTPEGAKKYAPQFKSKDGLFFATFIQASLIGYNTKLVTGADIPKRFADLTDAKYKGKVATAHPKHSGTGTEFAIMISERLGWNYYEKLKQNNLFIVRSQYELNPIAASGERPVSLAATEPTFMEDKAAGKPVDIIYPEEGVPVSWVPSGLMANAPHPNAGQLFQEWLHSPAGQSLIVSMLYHVPSPDATYPATRKRLSDIKTIALTPEEVVQKSENTKERFSDLFGG